MAKRAVGYCRISTLMQVDNTSLKDQEDKIRMYAKLHDIVIDEMFIDKAVSGKSTDRPEYDKMMDYVKTNDIDMIIVYKNDRIHRSLYNLLAMIYDLQEHEVALVSVTEMFDTSTPQGMLFLQMLGSFAEFERAVINERTRNGRIARLNENKWVGGKPAFGYKVNKQGQFEIDEEEAKKIGTVDFLVQGTIYPDVIESGLGKSSVIKSHHNVGGLPDYVDFKEIVEPLRNLFKDEVRQTGLELGIPENLVFRQPFPGPGLAIRIIGDITEDKLGILKDADSIFREEIANAGLNKSINQYFAVLTNLKSVGVMGDERTYDYTIALRAVETTDFMTGVWSKIPYSVLEKVSSRIVNEVKHVNRVVYDITSKPPATIEWE